MTQPDTHVSSSAASANEYAKDKSLTTRRSRTAQFIEAYLLRQRHQLLRLMASAESRMRQVVKPWPLSSVEGKFSPPLQIGTFALLAYPGALLETVQEDDDARVSKTRLLIRVTVNGTIFNLMAILDSPIEISWRWDSQEFRSDQITPEALHALKLAVERLMEVEIPPILAKLAAIPV